MKVTLIRRLGQHKAGDTIDRTAPEAEQLIRQGYASHVAEPEQADAVDVDSSSADQQGGHDDLDDLTLAELKDIAAREHVASYGTKAEIAARIRTARQDAEQEAPLTGQDSGQNGDTASDEAPASS